MLISCPREALDKNVCMSSWGDVVPGGRGEEGQEERGGRGGEERGERGGEERDEGRGGRAGGEGRKEGRGRKEERGRRGEGRREAGTCTPSNLQVAAIEPCYLYHVHMLRHAHTR